MAESPSGSKHRYFKHPGEGIKIMNSASRHRPRHRRTGDGGMVIAPPSVRGDGEYRWLNDIPIADAPQWLIDLVHSEEQRQKRSAKEPPKIEVAEAFKQLDPKQSLGEGIEHPVADIEQIRAAFAVIPNDNRGWDDWNKCGMALFHATAGSDDGLAVFHAWSSKSKKYNAQATADRWAAYKTCPPDRIGAGSIFHWANEAAPGWEQERRAKQIAENIKIGDDVTEPLLPQIMTLEEMRMRLVFVGSIGVVADLITGRVRKKEHAADEYAASQHTYIRQGNGTLKKGPALKLWIASKDRMTVEVLAWVPGAPQICQPPEGQGPAFNMWRGLSPMAYPEDWQERVKPFLEHVEFLVPIEQERERFLQWLAHIVQRPEVLPHTAYLMTTPMTGIGRNLLASILVRALRGFVAAGVSLPELLDSGFTGRLSQKLLVIVDEAREGSGERRYERASGSNNSQTEEHRHVNHKYGHQSVEKNCGRWLMFSNHDDAIPFDNADRRVIVIANPTIRKEDAYYERLYGLLNDKRLHRIGAALAGDQGHHRLPPRRARAHEPGQAAGPQRNDERDRAGRGRVQGRLQDRTDITGRDQETTSPHHHQKRHMFANVNDTHLTHAIRRAGMVNTGRRIMAYKKTRHVIGIVDGKTVLGRDRAGRMDHRDRQKSRPQEITRGDGSQGLVGDETADGEAAATIIMVRCHRPNRVNRVNRVIYINLLNTIYFFMGSL